MSAIAMPNMDEGPIVLDIDQSEVDYFEGFLRCVHVLLAKKTSKFYLIYCLFSSFPGLKSASLRYQRHEAVKLNLVEDFNWL